SARSARAATKELSLASSWHRATEGSRPRASSDIPAHSRTRRSRPWRLKGCSARRGHGDVPDQEEFLSCEFAVRTPNRGGVRIVEGDRPSVAQLVEPIDQPVGWLREFPLAEAER